MSLISKIKANIASDIQTVKDMFNGEEYIKQRAKDLINPKNIAKDLKTNWIFFLLMIGFLFGGMFLQAKISQNECNEYIYETYIELELDKYVNIPLPSNISIFDFHPSVPIVPTPSS